VDRKSSRTSMDLLAMSSQQIFLHGRNRALPLFEADLKMCTCNESVPLLGLREQLVC
jgi:hypothetical protein